MAKILKKIELTKKDVKLILSEYYGIKKDTSVCRIHREEPDREGMFPVMTITIEGEEIK